MTQLVLANAELLDPERADVRVRTLVIEGGRIAAVLERDARVPPGATVVDLERRRVAPGFLDLHFHGELIYCDAARFDAVFDATSRSLLAEGVTGFLATTVALETKRLREFMTHSKRVMDRNPEGRATVLGVHLEGPWINAEVAGAQPRSPLRGYDADDAGQVFEIAHETIRVVTLAPELPGSDELLRELARRGIVAALGHSLASSQQIDAAIELGLTHVTHLFNAMGPIHHREPGVAGLVLGDARLSCDLICDGVHVHPAMVRAAARAKGDKLMLITDRITPPDPRHGESSFGSGAVVDDGEALRLPDGTLAGSTLSLDRAVRNVQAFGAMDRLEAIRACTLLPARLLGIESQRGTLRVGARADLAVLDRDDRVVETWLAGERVFVA